MDLFAKVSSSHKVIQSVLPEFPRCEHLKGVKPKPDDPESYITCFSIFKELENNASEIYLINRLRKCPVPLKMLTPDTEWADKVWFDEENKEKQEKVSCVNVKNIQEFIEWAQRKTRKNKTQKERLFAKFNIEPVTIHVPVENKVMDVLQQCCPYVIETQYRVGKYKLDGFITRLRIGVEIDENGHKNYNENEEKIYEEVLRDHNIVLIRFNPDLHENSLTLIRIIWERTLSPDFVSFREKNKLV